MLTRLLVNRLLVNIAYMKIWVHLTFVLVHLRKKVSLEPYHYNLPCRKEKAQKNGRTSPKTIEHFMDVRVIMAIVLILNVNYNDVYCYLMHSIGGM